jgi:phosphonate transport system substrate-binding protein
MKITRRVALVAIGGLTGLLLTESAVRADWRDQLPVFRIGILGGNLGAQMIADHACWKRMVQQELGVPVDLFASPDYEGVIEGLLSGTLDAAELGAASYAAIYLRDPGAVEPLVASKQSDGTLGHHSVMVVRADSPYQSVEDLRGHSLAFTDPNSTSGYLVPTQELSEQGFEPRRHFGVLGFSGGHPQGVDAVLRGAVDAAVTWTSGIGDERRGFTRGNLRRMVSKGQLDMRDIRIVWQSKIIPEGPWVVRADLPAEAKERYERLLVELPRRDKACLENMVGGRTTGFEPITPDYYDTIIAIRRHLSGG